MSFCDVLESTTRKLDLRFESTLPTPASKKPVTVSSSVAARQKRSPELTRTLLSHLQ